LIEFSHETPGLAVTMSDSWVAGLRPEQGSNMGQHPAEGWVLAWARLCRKGSLRSPLRAVPKPNQHWVPAESFFGLGAG